MQSFSAGGFDTSSFAVGGFSAGVHMYKKSLSLALNLIIVYLSVAGVIMSCTAPIGAIVSGKYAILYFTVQSNVFIGCVSFVCAIMLIMELSGGKTVVSRRFFILKHIFTVSITLTGVVFCFILAPFIVSRAFTLCNVITHVLVPVFAVLDYFLCFADRFYCSKKEACYALIPPVLYVAFTTIGYFCGLRFESGVNYPYFFLNWGNPAGAIGFSDKPPYVGVVYMIVALAGLVAGISLLYAKISIRIYKKRFAKKGEK